MSDYDDEVEEETPQALDPNIRKQLREAEKARKELDSLRAELNAERREVQFAKVGIPDDGIGKLFRKAYDGEADADSIRKAAEEYGILGGAPAPQSSNQSELEALRRAQGATIGTSGALPDPGQEFMARVNAANSPEEIMSIIQETQTSAPGLGVWSSRGSF
jgi:hypothetical protein